MRHLRTPALRKKRRNKIIFRTMATIFVAICLFGIPAFFFRISALKINTVEVVGAKTIPESEVRDFVMNEISKKYIFLYPKSNVILVPEGKIENLLKNNFQRIENVNLSLSSLHSILVTLEERTTFAVWCKDEDSSICFFLDKNGQFFDSATESSKQLFFQIYGGAVNDSPIGSNLFQGDIFSRMVALKEGIKGFGLNTGFVRILTDNELDFGILGGGNIFFSMNNSSENTLSNLGSVLADGSLKLVKDGALTVSAIDLRYGNKVILKK